jgi:hypothetical protein
MGGCRIRQFVILCSQFLCSELATACLPRLVSRLVGQVFRLGLLLFAKVSQTAELPALLRCGEGLLYASVSLFSYKGTL